MGLRGSLATLPRTSREDSCDALSAAAKAASGTSFFDTTHWMVPVPSRTWRKWSLPVDRLASSQPRSRTSCPSCAAMSWMYTCFSMGARMVLPLRPRVEYDVAMLAMLLAIGVAGPSAGAVRVPSSERAWGGVRERGPERVADYDLSAVLDPFKHTLVGKERL